jgi:DNA-directed RNA polymerase subunit RPC12/RpoP
MYCSRCGHKQEENVRFCVGCGAQVQQHTPPPQQPTPPQSLYACPNCNSGNLKIFEEATTTHDGEREFGCAWGCLIVWLFPLGLVIWLLAAKRKQVTTRKTMALCQNCGCKLQLEW